MSQENQKSVQAQVAKTGPTGNKVLTTEEVAAKQAEKASRKKDKTAKRAAKNSAFEVLKAIVDASKDEKAKAALTTIRPALYGVVAAGDHSGNTSGVNKFVALVVEKKSISEDEVFKALKIGRKDAAGYIRKFLKKAAPADRVWINFDKGSGLYFVVGTGANAPKEYTGSIPTEETVNLR